MTADISFFLAILVYVLNAEMDILQRYTFHSTPESWTNAKNICETESKRLLAIQSPESLKPLEDDAAFNNTLLTVELWTGLSTADGNCKSYSWHGGVCLGNYTNWIGSEPDHCSTDKCVRIVKKKWRTMICTRQYAFICEGFQQDMKNFTSVNITEKSGTTARVTIVTTHTNCSKICSLLPSMTSELYGTVCSEVAGLDNITLTNEALEREITKLKQELTVTKTTTTLYLRSKTSVYEKRASAMTMGAIGMTMIIALILLLVLPDAIGVIKYIFTKLR